MTHRNIYILENLVQYLEHVFGQELQSQHVYIDSKSSVAHQISFVDSMITLRNYAELAIRLLSLLMHYQSI